jgi:iron complex transport system substrate-binding protein
VTALTLSLLASAALLAAAAPDTCTWKDDLGRRVTAPCHPRRILSYAPSVTEVLFAIGAGGRVVGRTRFGDYPPEARKAPVFGGLLDPDFEKIEALRPDLIVATTVGDPRNKVEALERLGYPVFMTSSNSVEGVIENVEKLGRVVDAEAGARAVAGRMRAQLRDVRARVAGRRRVRTLVVIWQDPLRTAGRGTFLESLVREAGGKPIVGRGKAKYPQMSMEAVLQAAPEVIVRGLPGEPGRGDEGFWKKFPAIPAVRDGRVVSIDLQRLGRPGPRVTEALADLARAIHPEAFSGAAAVGHAGTAR